MNNNEHRTGDELPALKTRFAEFGELALVLDMYMAALDEIKDHIHEPEESACAKEVLRSFNSAPCVLLEDKSGVIGFAGMKRVIAPFTSKPHLSEYMLYIRPDRRSIRAARALSRACQAVSDMLKLPLYMNHFLSGHSAADKVKFLERWGYKPIGVAVMYGGA